jgi:hypothetical protein
LTVIDFHPARTRKAGELAPTSILSLVAVEIATNLTTDFGAIFEPRPAKR